MQQHRNNIATACVMMIATRFTRYWVLRVQLTTQEPGLTIRAL
jgi:hypothetical protein